MIYRINDLDLPELHVYRTLRRAHEHKQQGIFVAEGAKVVQRLLLSELTIVSMLMTPSWYQALFGEKTPPFDVYLAEKQLLETIVGFPLHQGIMAVAKTPPERSLRHAMPEFVRPCLIVALDGIVSAENVGVIVRNASAFGATAIIAGGNSSSPYLRRAVRNSMGGVFRIPVFHSTNLLDDFQLLSADGVTIIGADPHAKKSIYDTDLSGSLCLVFGSEGEGLSVSLKTACHLFVSIPMHKGTDSLNVSSAAAVMLFEARRTRSMANHR